MFTLTITLRKTTENNNILAVVQKYNTYNRIIGANYDNNNNNLLTVFVGLRGGGSFVADDHIRSNNVRSTSRETRLPLAGLA